MFVRSYVRMYSCTYVHTYLCTYLCTYVCMHASLCMHVSVRMFVCTCTYVRMCLGMCIHTYIHMYIWTHSYRTGRKFHFQLNNYNAYLALIDRLKHQEGLAYEILIYLRILHILYREKWSCLEHFISG